LFIFNNSFLIRDKMNQKQNRILWLQIWKSDPLYQRFLTPEQAEKSEVEMMKKIQHCVEIWNRTFGK